MDALLKNQGALLLKHMKNPKDIRCTGNVIGIGPNGEVEELTIKGTHCAGKKLHASLLDPSKKNCQNLFAKFASDYNQMNQLNHPNITNFLGLCLLENMQDSSCYLTIIREYVKDNLAHLLETTPCIPLSIKTSILLDITKALEYLHSSNPSVVHRNLTSNNILITGSMQAKVADMECFCFNSSRQLDTKKLVFMPPETKRDNPKYETSLDMFSFGHTALHTAIQMFPGELSEAHNEVERRSKYIAYLKDPQGTDTILLELIINCLNDSPKKRPSANAAMRELEQLEQKLKCKGDKYHAIMKRMNMYEMAERLIESQEDSEPQCSEDAVQIDDPAAAKRRSMLLVTAQVKEGQPSVLYIHENVRGILSRRPKWMEYKFKISRSGSGQVLEYFKRLNDDRVIGSISLEAVVAVIAQGRVGNETVFPFYVHFRSGQWILGAHSEDERRIWMEAILPGSTQNQWADDFTPSSERSTYRQRSATSPADFRETHDPAYIKYHEILGPSNKPPPIPERPEVDEIMKGPPDNTYLPILPPDTDVHKRTKALARIKSLTTEQIDTMLQMFERDVKRKTSLDDTASDSKKHNKESCFQLQPERQPAPPKKDNINVQSSKHPSKGLYFCFSDFESSEESTSTSQELDVSNSTAANEGRLVKRPSLSPVAEIPISPRRQLGRQNALRRPQAPGRSGEGEKQSHSDDRQETKQGQSGTDATHKLRTLLRQQSSEDMLDDGGENPDWSRARLNDSGQPEVDSEPKTALSPEDALCQSLSIPVSSLHELNKIAIGHYGPIFKARLVDPAKPHMVTVAVKSFQSQLRERNHSFLQDLAIMVASRYQNVAQLYGVVHEHNWLVMEYASLGDLKQFLVRNRVSVSHLEKYMLDISMGMYYISSRGLVHRNLALRNILVGEDETCKVADLGMRHSLENGIPPQMSHSADYIQEVTQATDQRRWMAPENLTKGLFSEASDIWSFGVVQWEMFQPMRVPYAAIDSDQLPNHIIKGHTLEVPDISPEIVTKIMRACWHWNATKRPSFMYIASLLMKRTLGD